MSINVGFLNASYSLNKFSKIDNRLIINSYNDCNVILLNHDSGSHPESLINFKDKYSSGIKSNNYVVHHVGCNLDLLSLNENDFKINAPLTTFNKDVSINSLFYTKKDKININSNLNINLLTKNNSFNVKSLDPNISNLYGSNIINNISVSYNDVRFQVNSNILDINQYNLNIYGDLYIRSNVLYTNTIKNNTDSVVKIYNPYMIGLQVESTVFYDHIHIQNDKVYIGHPTLEISRYKNSKDIIKINTCNLTPNILPETNVIIDENGFIGIGSDKPIAPLSISKINPVIAEYHGLNYGDKFTLTNNANIGIGTNNPKKQLEIVRNDDLKQNSIRSMPLFGLDINYNLASNIITSNYKTTWFNIFDYTSNIFLSNVNLITSCNMSSNNVLVDFYTNENKILYLNGSIINSNYIIQNNFNVFDSDMYDTIYNISNVIVNNKEEFLTIANNTLNIDEFNNYILYNKIYYPYVFYGSERIDDFLYTCNVNDNVTTHEYNYGYIIASSNTNVIGYIDNSNIPSYNSSNFKIVSLSRTLSTIDYNSYIKYNFNLYVEKNRYLFDYIDTRPKIVPAPYFMYTTSNNTFVSSLSSYGTLSLGKESPFKETYLLYAPGKSVITTLETDIIMGLSSSNISYSYCNIIDVDLLKTNSNISTYFESDISIINNLKVNNISINAQNAVSVNTSNINFTTLNSSYINVTNSNFHINTPLSVSRNNLNKQVDNNALVKFTIDNKIVSSNIFYKHNKALIVTNDKNISNINVNPTISIIGYDNSIPYLNLKTNSSDYFMRVNSNLYSYNNNEWSDVFELCCDTISGSIRENYYSAHQKPHILQHIKNYNLVTIGENNTMCLDILDRSSIYTNLQPNTNSTNKITLGLPSGILDNNSIIYSDWPQYLNNNIVNDVNNPYMLNVYGNVNISSIYGKSIIRAKVDNGNIKNASQETVNIGINGDPKDNTTLYVYGNAIYDNSITTSNNLNVFGEGYMSKTLTVEDKIYANSGVMTSSDLSLKTDLKVIDDALDKLYSLTGYTYYRIDTGNREAGLIAQDVYKILPEVVSSNNSILNISYGNLSSLIIEAIKELKDRVSYIECHLGI